MEESNTPLTRIAIDTHDKLSMENKYLHDLYQLVHCPIKCFKLVNQVEGSIVYYKEMWSERAVLLRLNKYNYSLT